MMINPLIELKEYVATFKTQREAADKLGISEAYMTDLLKGRRGFSNAMLDKLHLRSVVVRATQQNGKAQRKAGARE